MPRDTGPFEPIAIVGTGCVFPPDATDVGKFWHNLRSGVSGIGVPTADRWSWELYFDEDRAAPEKTYCRLGGFVRDYTFGARDLAARAGTVLVNRTQQFALDACYQALAVNPDGQVDLTGQRSMLIMANMLGDELWGEASLNHRKAEVIAYLAGAPEFAALDDARREDLLAMFSDAVDKRFPPLRTTRPELLLPTELPRVVARTLGVDGPSFLVDGACAGGLMVIDSAVRYLQDHTADLVVAVAVMANMAVTGNVAFAKIGGLSPDRSRPLDTTANGLVPSEGAGAVVLKRLTDAIAAGDRVLGVIRGIASRTDGKGKAIYAPSSRGQVDAMRRALDLAGWTMRDIDHVETHATATLAGDKVELASLLAMVEAFGTELPAGSISVGSVKGLIGHAFPAAGMANLIKILSSLEHEEIAPTHHVTAPQPQVSGRDVPFAVHGEPQPWPAGRPRRALANAFGFGGVNSSICVEGFDAAYHATLVGPDPSPGTASPGTASAGIASAVARCRAAIVGVAVRTSYASNLSELVHGQLGAPAGYPAGRGHARAAEIYDPDGARRTYPIDFEFPWLTYRIPPDTLKAVDRAQQLALVVAGEALHDAGDRVGTHTAVIVGSCAGLEAATARNLLIRAVEYEAILAEVLAARRADGTDASTDDAAGDGALDATRAGAAVRAALGSYTSPTMESALPGYMDNIVPGRIGNMFDLRAANIAVDAGRGSFAVALDLGLRVLGQGECDELMVGAVSANLSDELVLTMADDSAAGSGIPAEAAVFFLLKPVEKVTPADTVYAVVTGVEPIPASAVEYPSTGEPDYFGAIGAVRLAAALGAAPASRPVTVTVPFDGTAGYAIRLAAPPGADDATVAGATVDGADRQADGSRVWRGLTDSRVDEVLTTLAAGGIPPEAGAVGGGSWDLALRWQSPAELSAKAAAALAAYRSGSLSPR